MSQQFGRQPRHASGIGGQRRTRGGQQRGQRTGFQGGLQRGGQPRFQARGRSVGTGSVGRGGVTGGTGAMVTTEAAQYPDTFVDHLTKEMRMVLDDSIEVSQVALWCADKCIDQGPEMADCVRLCTEVAEIAELNAKLISKDAYNVLPITEVFVDVAEQAIAELDRFEQPHTEETAAVLDRAIASSVDLLDSY